MCERMRRVHVGCVGCVSIEPNQKRPPYSTPPPQHIAHTPHTHHKSSHISSPHSTSQHSAIRNGPLPPPAGQRFGNWQQLDLHVTKAEVVGVTSQKEQSGQRHGRLGAGGNMQKRSRGFFCVRAKKRSGSHRKQAIALASGIGGNHTRQNEKCVHKKKAECIPAFIFNESRTHKEGRDWNAIAKGWGGAIEAARLQKPSGACRVRLRGRVPQGGVALRAVRHQWGTAEARHWTVTAVVVVACWAEEGMDGSLPVYRHV